MDFIFICVYIENLKQKDVVKGDFFSGLEPSPCHMLFIITGVLKEILHLK